ncbi:tannase and feruloyl esterase [Thozetella sp. PMI_491]|nr:tannase and feruloyl esterase [Thozetella sp. PMI_491]
MAKFRPLPILGLLPLLFHFCLADNPCPGEPADSTGPCSRSTFDDVLRDTGAFIVSVNKVPRGKCFGQDPAVDLAPAAEPSRDPKVPLKNAADHLLVDSCAVIAGNAGYRFGLILPDPTVWTGSLLAVGNPSYVGGINWGDMGHGVNQGLATLSTDTGHNSSGDFTWGKNNPTALEDWGFQAMNGSVVFGKRLTEAYYSAAANAPKQLAHSYYAGCSTGGRQGLMAIQRTPNLFSGVLVGAPAWDQTHLVPWTYKVGIDNYDVTTNSVIIDPNNVQWITNYIKIRDWCDARDGVNDTVISRPDLCNFAAFAPENLQCGGSQADPTSCYSPAQIAVLTKVFSDTLSDNTTFVYQATEIGSEVGLFSGFLSVMNNLYDAGLLLGYAWAQNFVDLTPDISENGVKQILEKALANDPGKATANNVDLTAFKASGGKLIMYQGLADGIIPPRSTTNYWLAMQSKTSQASDFARYFQVPGMYHCWQSDTDASGAKSFSPWMMGGAGQAVLAAEYYPSLYSSLFGKKETDALAALISWVENNDDPVLVATAPNGDAGWRTRPLCPFPQNATLKTGVSPTSPDMDSDKNWECKP